MSFEDYAFVGKDKVLRPGGAVLSVFQAVEELRVPATQWGTDPSTRGLPRFATLEDAQRAGYKTQEPLKSLRGLPDGFYVRRACSAGSVQAGVPAAHTAASVTRHSSANT